MNQPKTPPETVQTEPREPLPTIWEAPDALWEKLFLPLLTELDPPSRMGRPRANQRKCLDGMIYRAHTGCQWNRLPKPKEFGSDSTLHRTVWLGRQRRLRPTVGASVAGPVNPLGEEAGELSSEHEDGLCFALVPPDLPGRLYIFGMDCNCNQDNAKLCCITNTGILRVRRTK